MKVVPLVSEQSAQGDGEVYLEGRRDRKQLAWHVGRLLLLVFCALQELCSFLFVLLFLTNT